MRGSLSRMKEEPMQQDESAPSGERRCFLNKAAMTCGLTVSYGTLTALAGRFLYPARLGEKTWVYVCDADSMKSGDALAFKTPAGVTINVTRQDENGSASDFLALSSTCPHLGCQVHWEAHNDRFFCPCHNGVFTSEGKGISGPPGDAAQWLPRYPLRIEKGLLFMEVEVGGVM